MKTLFQRYKYAAALYAVVVLSASVIIVTATTKPTGRQDGAAALPRVVSKIKQIEVLSAYLKQGDDSAAVAIQIRNNSDKAVIAITIESGNKKDSSGITRSRSLGDKEPGAVIEPYGTIIMELPLSYVLPGHPVRVAGVLYADGTEAGDDFTLEAMRRLRGREKAKADAKKQEPPQ